MEAQRTHVDPRIQQAIEARQKNLETMKLARNWCAEVVDHRQQTRRHALDETSTSISDGSK
jgi:hypothetical protein